MGKANRGGQKRKEAPARKQLQGRGGNSGLLHKNNPRRQQHGAAGLDGGATMGKRTLAQQLLQPNKRARGGKRRRKGDGRPSKPGSSETAAIQAEYAAVDAREKAKADAEASRRLRVPVKVKLAPPTTALRMPSEGAESMASLRASSSARMVEALLQSITDDPAPNAPPSRPVRSAGRKRKGNPYAALGDGDDDDNSDSESDSEAAGGAGGGPDSRGSKGAKGAGLNGAFGSASVARAAGSPMAFASPASFPGFSGGGGRGGGGGGWSVGAGGTAGVTGGGLQTAVATSVDDDDPDL
eukprot:g14559.t1